MKLTTEEQAFQLLEDGKYAEFKALIQKRSFWTRKPACDLEVRKNGISLLQAAARVDEGCADTVWQLLTQENNGKPNWRYGTDVCFEAVKQYDIPAVRYFIKSGILAEADRVIDTYGGYPCPFQVFDWILSDSRLMPVYSDIYRYGNKDRKYRVATAASLLNLNVAKDYLTYGDISLIQEGYLLQTKEDVALFFLDKGVTLTHNLLSSAPTPAIADKLIELGQDVHAVDEYGNNVLRRTNNPKMFRYYVEKYGADINLPNKRGETILDWHYRFTSGGDLLPQNLDLFVRAGAVCSNSITARDIAAKWAKAKMERAGQPDFDPEKHYIFLCAQKPKKEIPMDWIPERC